MYVFPCEVTYICDPPYDFRDKGDSTLTTHFLLKTKETGYNTLAEHARAHFNELMVLFHVTHSNNKVCAVEQ